MQHDYFQLLVQAAQRGRKNSFIDLCELNAKKIFTLCVRMLTNETLAHHISVKIYLQAWENIQFVRADTAFEVWLRSIAIYTILEEIRTKKLREELKLTSEEIPPATNDPLEKILLHLPEIERAIYILHEMEGYTYSEITDFFTNYDEQEIKSSVRNIRRKIAMELKNEL
jgi:RNA polymerase sigma-70 factor (ECF subfamily)